MGGVAACAGNSNATILDCTYTVQMSDSANPLDYASASALVVNGTLKDELGQDAVLTLPAPGSMGSLASSNTIALQTVVVGALKLLGPTTIFSGVCALYAVVLTDANGIEIVSSSNITVYLANSHGSQFMSTGAACFPGSTSSLGNQVTFPVGQNSVNFYVLAAAAANGSISISATNATISGSPIAVTIASKGDVPGTTDSSFTDPGNIFTNNIWMPPTILPFPDRSSAINNSLIGAGGTIGASITRPYLFQQPDGKILGADGSDTIYRYLANGSVDSTFGSNGSVSSTSNFGATRLAAQKDGKILVTGSGNSFAGS